MGTKEEKVEEEVQTQDESSDDVMAPDTSFLSNPTDDSNEKLKEFDQHYLNSLSNKRRALADSARKPLYEGVFPFNDSVDALSLKDNSFRYMDSTEQVYLSGKLTIKHSPRAHMIPSRSIKQYLDQLQNFEGSCAELVAHIAQDLFITMKPQKVSVTFQSKESGLDIRAQKTHEWGVGFK